MKKTESDKFEGNLSEIRKQKVEPKEQLWKKNDAKAEKTGPHRTIYWVKQKQKFEDGSFKGEKWVTDVKYVGDWKGDKKWGFGIQYYANGNRYEGGWENNMRNGQGTLWVHEGKKKLRREYTGDWQNDKKTGRGTMFYKNGDRYDGLWLNDLRNQTGRMIYANGDVYEGFWFMGKRSGYGVLTKRNGDHFEGQWVNDKREGQGSYFFSQKNQVFVGEWVDDMPKSGVFSGVEDPENPLPKRENTFRDPYILPPLPSIKLKNPTKVLQDALEKVRQDRTFYRATYIPISELFTEEELTDLMKEFEFAQNEKEFINMVNLTAILANMNFEQTEEEIENYLKILDQNYKEEEIYFELFARLIAILLEENNNLQRMQNNISGVEGGEEGQQQQLYQYEEGGIEGGDEYQEGQDYYQDQDNNEENEQQQQNYQNQMQQSEDQDEIF